MTGDRAGDPPAPTPRSGRRVVSAIVVTVLLLWFGLDRAFRAWAARYQARASFGATKVAPTVDPLAGIIPPATPPDAWDRAVLDTHAMLVALTGSGLLDESQMETLRRHLENQVHLATLHPETARAILAQIWDDLERSAGPAIAPDLLPPPPNSRQAKRHPRPARPKILGPSRRLS